jgi:putative flippase GtrA
VFVDNPMDMEFGDDGALYVLEYGDGFFSENPDAQLARVDYVRGNRTPVVVANIVGHPDPNEPLTGLAPLTVRFSSAGTNDPAGDRMVYAWYYDAAGVVDSREANPTFTYTENGVFDATLRVTDTTGRMASASVTVIVGNTPPIVELTVTPSSVPFQFGERYAGQSKASLREGMRFLNLLLSLRFGPRFTKFSQFGLVGVSGLLVNSLLLAFWTETAGLYYMLSLVLATQGSSLWNFFLSEYWVFKRANNHRGSQVSRGAMFLAMNNVALLARGPMVFLFTSFLGVNYLISNVASMAVLLLIRYAVADSLIWKLGPAEAVVASATLPVSPQEQEATS